MLGVFSGNDAAHDEEPFSTEDAEQLASFTELFLMYVFQVAGHAGRAEGQTNAGGIAMTHRTAHA
jgi:hypothetical protein